MTVKELIDQLNEMPEDAIVKIDRHLIGDQNYAQSVAYREFATKHHKDKFVYIRDVPEDW